VKRALIADGWTITHDPYPLAMGTRRGFIDLAAEIALAAARDERTIAVEVKSFIGPSPLADVEQALGQYLVYRSWLSRTDPARELYLAVDSDTARDIFDDRFAAVLIEDYRLRLLVVEIESERIAQWRS
jgi:hypothetical protein